MKKVIYKGIPCTLLEDYLGQKEYSIVMIQSPKDLKKAYALGFRCIGYPSEVAKEITKEECKILLEKGKLQ